MVNWIIMYRGEKIDSIEMESELNKKEVRSILIEDGSYPESIKVKKVA